LNFWYKFWLIYIFVNHYQCKTSLPI
jgi:hypothetical protein